MTGFRKIQFYIILAVISYLAMCVAFREYLKPAARGLLYLGKPFTSPSVLYMPFVGIVGLFTVPFVKRKKILLVVALFFQLAPFSFLLYSRNFDTFSNPSFYIPALLYPIFATLTTISVFQNNSIPEQRIPIQR